MITRPKKYSQKVILSILNRRAAGESFPSIGASLGITKQAAYSIFKRYTDAAWRNARNQERKRYYTPARTPEGGNHEM